MCVFVILTFARAPLKPAMLSWMSLTKYCHHHHNYGKLDGKIIWEIMSHKGEVEKHLLKC